MKIVLIAGTWYRKKAYESIWRHLRRSLEERYPGVEIVAESVWYQPWEIEKISAFNESILKKYDTGEDLVLIGHSMGGITACGIAPKFKMSRVLCIATIFSPHTLGRWIPFLNFTKQLFPESLPLKTTMLSFGGLFDPLVWSFFTKHPKAVHHEVLPSDHRFILGWNPSLGEHIAKVIRNYVEPIY